MYKGAITMNHPLPRGWQEKTIGEIFQFIKNYTNSRAELNDYDEISYIHYGDMHKYYRHRIECDKIDFPKISAEKLSKDISKISYAKNGDLIVVDASEDYEGTCISAEIKNLNYKLVSGMHTFLLRDENKIFADGYRGYIFYNHDVHIQCCKIATGISVYGISQENLKNIKIMIPPLDEQKRIADILSTFDDLIENLNKLIEKKEIYKKGVMQRVLTGEVRFNGFTDEWETVKLSSVVKIQSGYAFKSNNFKKSGIPVIRISNISNYDNYMDMDEVVYHDEIEDDKLFSIYKNDILIAMSGATTGKTSIYNLDSKSYLNQRVGLFRIIDKEKIDNVFLSQYVFSNYFLSQLKPFLIGGAQPNISSKDIETIIIPLPSIKEQKKIAELLTLIDKDIEILKQLLHLRKLQKKGVMQKLLTGEVRV